MQISNLNRLQTSTNPEMCPHSKEPMSLSPQECVSTHPQDLLHPHHGGCGCEHRHPAEHWASSCNWTSSWLTSYLNCSTQKNIKIFIIFITTLLVFLNKCLYIISWKKLSFHKFLDSTIIDFIFQMKMHQHCWQKIAIPAHEVVPAKNMHRL